MTNPRISFKPFLISAAVVFVMVSLQLSHVRHHISFPGFRTDSFEQIKPKIEIKKSDFQIKDATLGVQSASASQDFDQASAYGVIDFNSGEILMEKNLSKRLPIASLTKLMTAVITLDLVGDNEKFNISQDAANVLPTRMGLIPGQRWNRDELLTGLLMTSANDTAEVLQEGIDNIYGSGIFIRAMNEKAKFLGLKNTSFANPQGFDSPSNFSSVKDLMLLTEYAIENYPEIADIVKKDYQFFPATEDHKQADLYNWNGLLEVYPGTLGVKIGNTDAAGVCTIVLSQRSGRKLLAVLLGAPGVLERDLWASQLLDTAFNKTSGLDPVNITEVQLRQKYSSWKYFN